MDTEIFKTKFNRTQKYAVAVPIEGGNVAPIQSYDTLPQLIEGYKLWQQYAFERQLTTPVAIEFIDNKGKCKILTDILQDNKNEYN